jgi:mitogen-activated protein kinase kinase 1
LLCAQVAVVLEYMNLGGLEDIMKKGPIPEHVLASMSYQMLWGLGYLQHERRIHRDIKPANVLINTDGDVKLTDFGISREMQTAMLAKTFVGSFRYMAPERISGGSYDYASDIWSFGLVVLEAALGRYPYPHSKSTVGYVSIVADGDVPKLPEDAGFTPQFRQFIEATLQRDPSLRANAVQLLDSEWMMRHGCDSLEGSAVVVAAWLQEAGFSSDIPTAAAAVRAGGGGGEGKHADAPSSEGKK